MGRVHRTIIVGPPGKAGFTVKDAKIDPGADLTTIPYDAACKLGLDIETAVPAAAGSLGGRTFGFMFSVEVRIASIDKRAVVNAYVPAMDPHGNRIQGRYLVGHDFMQATGSKLDYSRHGTELSGLPRQKHPKELGPGESGPATAQETRLLRQLACPRSRRPRSSRR